MRSTVRPRSAPPYFSNTLGNFTGCLLFCVSLLLSIIPSNFFTFRSKSSEIPHNTMVVSIFLCPIHFCNVFGGTPLNTHHVANVFLDQQLYIFQLCSYYGRIERFFDILKRKTLTVMKHIFGITSLLTSSINSLFGSFIYRNIPCIAPFPLVL